MELRQTDLDSDDSDYDIDSDDDIFVPGFATSWIAPYLLELELNEKEPPYLAFKEYRGLDNLFHFKIQFKTEIYQKWVYNSNGFRCNYNILILIFILIASILI